jgi:hypothetical protein
MKLDNRNWLITIVLTCGFLATGCAKLSSSREALPAAGPSSGSDSAGGRPSSGSSAKESFFFNEKSREIEESLGL